MGINPQDLRKVLTQTLKDATDKAPKRHQNRKLRNHTSDGSTVYDPSEEITAMGAAYTKGRERYWRSLGKQVRGNHRITVRG